MDLDTTEAINNAMIEDDLVTDIAFLATLQTGGVMGKDEIYGNETEVESRAFTHYEHAYAWIVLRMGMLWGIGNMETRVIPYGTEEISIVTNSVAPTVGWIVPA